MRRVRIVLAHRRMGRCHVDLPAGSVSSSSDLLANGRRSKLHVVVPSGWLGYSHHWFGHTPTSQWSVVPFRTDVPHQPSEQLGRFLDPTLDLRRSHGHYSVRHLWVLHQGVPGVVGRQQLLDRRLFLPPCLLGKHPDHVTPSSVQTSPPSCAAPMAWNRHRPDHHLRCHLLRCCLCLLGHHRRSGQG